MMINPTPSLFCIIAVVALLVVPVCAETALNESTVTILEDPTPQASNVSKADLPVERISQGQCVEIGRYYDISGVIGWSTQFSYYGKYSDALSPENGTYTMKKIIDHPMSMRGLGKYYIDPAIFGDSEGVWYQVSTLSVNSNHEWAGNMQAFKVQSYCPEELPETVVKVQQNESMNETEALPLPVEHVTDILVVRGDSVAYSDARIAEGSKVWIFGIEKGLYDIPTPNQTLILTSEQTQSLPEGRYHIIVDSPGKNRIVESAYDPETEIVSSPLRATPDITFYGVSSQVAYGNYIDWMWKYSDDDTTLIDMQLQDDYINVYSIEVTNPENQTGLTIKGYTNLRNDSVVYATINEDVYGALVTRAHGAVVGDNVGDLRQFVIKSKIDINELVAGRASIATVHGEHDAKVSVPFYVYNNPEGHYIPTQYNKYIAGNLYVPTPTPEIIIMPTPTPEVIEKIVEVTVTIPVTPSQEQVNEAQKGALLELLVIIGSGLALLVMIGYGLSVLVRSGK